jgi:hypothetical protein
MRTVWGNHTAVIRDQGLGARLADIRRRARTLPIPPFVKMGALIAVGMAPFIFFVILQSADNPSEPDQLPTQPVGDQRVPLAFPFGTPEPSPTPSEAGESTTTSKPPSPSPAQCADGRDNDGDGRTDLADRGCASRSDRSEADAVATTRPTTRPVATTTTTALPPTTTQPPTTVPPTTAAPQGTTQPPAPTTTVFKGECEDGIDNDDRDDPPLIDAADPQCKLDLDDPPEQQSE